MSGARYHEVITAHDNRAALIKDRATDRNLLVVTLDREDQLKVLRALNHYEDTGPDQNLGEPK